MFLSLSDLGAEALKRGSTARGSAPAQLPKPPSGLKWTMIPDTGVKAPASSPYMFTYEYMLTTAPTDWNPPVETPPHDTSPPAPKLTPKPMTTAPPPVSTPTLTPARRMVGVPWYKKPVVLIGIGVGSLLATVGVVLLVKR